MKLLKLLILSSIVLFGCQTKQKPEDKKAITVSILPQKTFVERIAGTDFKVNVLIPPGASPAAYTLLPSQLKDIANSVAWFRIGYIGFERSWKDKIIGANPSMKVYNLAEGIDLIAAEKEQHGDHVHMEGVDPHIWMSPANVKIMAKQIRDRLTELNPEGASKYQTNYQKFIKEIDNIHIQIKTTLREHEGKTIILFHPSLTYYARDYNLNQVSLESGGKEPTPQHVKEIVDLANEKNIRVVYIQTEFDREHARIFANEINGEIIQVAPLKPDWENNILEITQIFADNF